MRIRNLLLVVIAAVLGASCAAYTTPRPRPVDDAVERPARINREVRREPFRLDSSDPGRTATALITWASSSKVSERESVRSVIVEAGRDERLVRALCDEVFSSRTKDHSRTVIALAVIGETRSDGAERCLTEFVRIPFPISGHDVHGEIIEQTALGTLQAKAVDGLAYRMTASADAEVLRLMREHPSRIVRAEAISAYLWNRNDAAEAKAAIANVVRPDERIFLDRVRRVSGDTAATFNAKLRTFLEKYPDLQPPRPERSTDDAGVKVATDCDIRPKNQTPPATGSKGN